MSLFDGIPADLRSKVQENSVRRDRANDWLRDHVNGKGKTIEIQLPVVVTAARTKEGTYTIGVALGRKKGGGGAQFPGFPRAGDTKVAVLGDEWTVSLGFAPKDSEEIWSQLEREGVSAADAEKLVELERATFKGNVKLAALGTAGYFRVILDDVQMDGKKMVPKNLNKGVFKPDTGGKKKGGA